MKKFDEFINEDKSQVQIDLENKASMMLYLSTWFKELIAPRFESFDDIAYVSLEGWTIESEYDMFEGDKLKETAFWLKIRDFEDEELEISHVIMVYENIKEGLKDVAKEIRLHRLKRYELYMIVDVEKIYDPNLAKSWGMVNKYSL